MGENWKTTLVGIAAAVSAVVLVFQGPEANGLLDPMLQKWMTVISLVLTALVGALAKDSDKASNRDQSVVDTKLGNVPPQDPNPPKVDVNKLNKT